MNFAITRDDVSEAGAFGTAVGNGPSGALGSQCFQTLERTWIISDSTWHPKIPEGSYTCKRRRSPHFGYDVFEVLAVPGHSYIELHIANTVEDLEGCIGLGLSRGYIAGEPAILQSRQAFQEFMALQTGLDTFTLTIA